MIELVLVLGLPLSAFFLGRFSMDRWWQTRIVGARDAAGFLIVEVKMDAGTMLRSPDGKLFR